MMYTDAQVDTLHNTVRNIVEHLELQDAKEDRDLPRVLSSFDRIIDHVNKATYDNNHRPMAN